MSFVGSLVQYQPDSSRSGISGTLTAVTITCTAPNESVQVNSAPSAGTINGSAVTLNLVGLLGATATVYGTLNGGSLTISVLNSQTGSTNAGTHIGNARSAISTLQKDLASLSAAALPAPTGALDGITAARQATKQAISTADADIDQVNAGDASACAVASGIATGSCAGQGPGSPPSPGPHIS